MTKRNWSIAAAGALAMIAAVVAYAPGLHGPFLFDDFANVTIAQPTTDDPAEFIDVITRNRTGLLARPISFASFTANHYLFGPEPTSYKVFNLLIHLLVAGLIFVVVRQLMHTVTPSSTTAMRVAGLTALIWLLHPLFVSSVLYVVQRMAQLAALFSLAAVALYVKWRLSSAEQRLHPLLLITAVFFLTAAAILAKESGALVPLLLAVIELAIRTGGKPARKTDQAVLIWLVVVPLLAGMVALGLLHERFLNAYQSREFDLWERLATQSIVLWHYLGLILLPRIAEMGLYRDDFPIYSPTDVRVWIAVLAWLGTITASLLLRRRYPLLMFGVLWFLACHAMESTFLALELVFEHRNYLAAVGPLLIVSVLAVKLFQRWRFATTAILVPLLLFLTAATFLRSSGWRSTETFALLQVNNHPHSARAQLAAAQADAAAGRTSLALQRVARIRQLRPDAAWPHLLPLNFACAAQAEPSGLVQNSARSFATADDAKDVVNGLRQLVARKIAGSCAGLSIESLEFLIRQAAENPRLKRAVPQQRLLILLARLSVEADDDSKAIEMLQAAIAMAPDNYVAAFELGYLYLNRGRFDQAEAMVAHLRELDARSSRRIAYLIDELEAYIHTARSAADQ